MYLQGLSVGVDATIMNSYLGRVLNRVKDAYERQDFEEARKQQVGFSIWITIPLYMYNTYFDTEIYRVMPWLLEKFEENTVSIFVHVQVQ